MTSGDKPARRASTASAELEVAARRVVASKGRVSERRRLHRLFDAHWRYSMAEYPELATFVGWPGHDHRWTDLSLDAVERRRRELEVPVAVLDTIDRERLDDADRLSFDLFARDAHEALEGRRFPGDYMPVTQMGGVQHTVPQLLAMMPLRTVRHYDDAVSRLRGVAALVDQTIALMDRGLERGVSPPRVTLRDVPQQVLNLVTDEPLASPLLGAFTRFPGAVPARERERLAAEAAEAYRYGIAPALRKLHAYLVETYLPRARESTAMSDLPDGEDWYGFNVRQSTTTRLSQREIHEIGLREVARIRAVMEGVMAEAGHAGRFAEFTQLLRTDARFFFESAELLLAAYRDICKRADPELARLFGTLPRLPYGVLPVPSHAERSQTTAYYEPGSPEAGRPGYFYANTYDLKSRPKWEMEALSLHEAVPGHHLQIALAQEMKGLPEFRRHALYTAYVEGWGLYSESLGAEMGFYRDVWSRFGQLTYEMWRAVRLVVDTGMHVLGWTRERAIEFFHENTGKAEHDIVVEVDRYLVWPGQALAYKIGELKIRELRARAERDLGAGFDPRAFHDQILGAGPVPLDVLEDRVIAWIDGASAGASPSREPRRASRSA